MKLRVVLVLLSGLVLCGCQLDCPSPNSTDIAHVISLIVQSGEASSDPVVSISDFNFVCRAFGEQQGRLRGVSVVVEYTCTGHSNCQTDTVVEQIESGCLNGAWSNNVGGTTDSTFILSPLDGASLSTTAREDCSRCFSTQLANDAGISTDPVTHCVGECISIQPVSIPSLVFHRM